MAYCENTASWWTSPPIELCYLYRALDTEIANSPVNCQINIFTSQLRRAAHQSRQRFDREIPFKSLLNKSGYPEPISSQKGGTLNTYLIAYLHTDACIWSLRYDLYPVLLEFQHHIVLWRKTNACTHDILQCSSLFGEGIHHRCIIRNERRLSQVRQQRSDRVEVVETRFPILLELNSTQELCNSKSESPVQETSRAIFFMPST